MTLRMRGGYKYPGRVQDRQKQISVERSASKATDLKFASARHRGEANSKTSIALERIEYKSSFGIECDFEPDANRGAHSRSDAFAL